MAPARSEMQQAIDNLTAQIDNLTIARGVLLQVQKSKPAAKKSKLKAVDNVQAG